MTESRLPLLAIILSIAGLIPFVVTALGAVGADPSRGHIAPAALLAYGGIVLAFLGGVHWGFVVEGVQEEAENSRLALGVLPALIGFAAVLFGLTNYPVLGLALLIFGYIATAVVEGRGHRLELVPRGYMVLRWVMTVIVVALLTTVLVLRLLGANVML